MTSLNQHTYKKWRASGDYHLELMESFQQVPGGLPRKSDCFGFVDVLAVPRGTGPWVWIQVTSKSNISARLKKIRTEKRKPGTQYEVPNAELARRIIARGDLLLIEGWHKVKNRYQCVERYITEDDLT